MELSRRLLENKEFALRRKGYDQDAVDDFLERIGVAVDALQDRLRAAEERVDHLETVSGASGVDDQELNEAREEAAKALAEAEASLAERQGDLDKREAGFEASSEELVVALEERKAELEQAGIRQAEEYQAVLTEAKLEASKIRAQGKTEAARLRDQIRVQRVESDAEMERLREEVEAAQNKATSMSEDLARAIQDAERTRIRGNNEVDALTAEAEDMLTGAQEAAENILRDARAQAKEIETAAASADGSAYSPAAAVLIDQGRRKAEEIEQKAADERDVLLAEARATKDEAEERVQRATLLRDEAERLVSTAKSSADLARVAAINDARKIAAEDRRQARAEAEAILAEARREREAFLTDTRHDAEQIVQTARRNSSELEEMMDIKRADLDAYREVVDEARRQADAITSDAATESARLMSAAQAAASQRADKVKERMRGEVADLERARSNLRYEVSALDGEIEAQRERLTKALVEARALNESFGNVQADSQDEQADETTEDASQGILDDASAEESEEFADSEDSVDVSSTVASEPRIESEGATAVATESVVTPEIGVLRSGGGEAPTVSAADIEQMGGAVKHDDTERTDDPAELDEDQRRAELEEIGGALKVDEPQDGSEHLVDEESEDSQEDGAPKRRRLFGRRKE